MHSRQTEIKVGRRKVHKESKKKKKKSNPVLPVLGLLRGPINLFPLLHAFKSSSLCPSSSFSTSPSSGGIKGSPLSFYVFLEVNYVSSVGLVCPPSPLLLHFKVSSVCSPKMHVALLLSISPSSIRASPPVGGPGRDIAVCSAHAGGSFHLSRRPLSPQPSQSASPCVLPL